MLVSNFVVAKNIEIRISNFETILNSQMIKIQNIMNVIKIGFEHWSIRTFDIV